jgi:O-antigen/teichoic acid export membrane protein
MPDASRRALSAVAASSGTSLAAAAVAFIVNILMARHLGPGPRGEVAWVLQGAYVIAPLLALGVDRQALREPRRTSAISQRHVWVLGGVGVTVSLAFGSFAVAACLAAAAWGAALAIERGVGMATGSLGRFITLQMAVQVWILAASTVLFISKVDGPLWWLAVYAAPAPLILVLSVGSGPRAGGSLRHTLLGTANRRSVAYMMGGFGILMAARVERLILPVLASTKELGLYVAIATASEMLIWAAAGLGESRVVRFLTSNHTRRSLVMAAARDYSYFLVVAVPLAAGIHFLMLPLLGPAFADADVLIVPLCLASVSWATYLQLSAVWLARGSVSQSIRLDAGAAILTAGCVTALIPPFGALGAAWGCLAAYSTMIPVAIALLPRIGSDDAPAASP